MKKITSFAAVIAVTTLTSQAVTSVVGLRNINANFDTDNASGTAFGRIDTDTNTATDVVVDAATSSSANGNLQTFVVTGDYDGDGIATDRLSFQLNYIVRNDAGTRIEVANALNGGTSLILTDAAGGLESLAIRVNFANVTYSDASFSTDSVDLDFVGYFSGDSGAVTISDATDTFTSSGGNGVFNLVSGERIVESVFAPTSLDGAGTIFTQIAGSGNNNLSGLRLTATINAVPEPSSAALLGLGGLALLARRKR